VNVQSIPISHQLPEDPPPPKLPPPPEKLLPEDEKSDDPDDDQLPRVDCPKKALLDIRASNATPSTLL
jgi:hypothetical protein